MTNDKRPSISSDEPDHDHHDNDMPQNPEVSRRDLLGSAAVGAALGALATAGGLVFTGYTDGTFVAYDDASMEPVWKINVGTGFNAPPMTFEVNGKQYVAILSGLSPISKRRHSHTPELREMRNQTMLFVFGL